MTDNDKALVVAGEALRLKEAKREAMRDRLARLRRRMEWDTYSYLVNSFGSDIACLLGSMRVVTP